MASVGAALALFALASLSPAPPRASVAQMPPVRAPIAASVAYSRDSLAVLSRADSLNRDLSAERIGSVSRLLAKIGTTMKWRDGILSEAEVLKIRKLVEIGISQVDIARRFGKSLSTINKVVKSQGRYAAVQTQ